MAKQQEDVKKRTVLVPVDGSEHSERAFDCEYWRLSWLAVHNWPIRLRYIHCFRTIDLFPVKSQLIFPLSTHEALNLSAQMFKAFSLYLTGSTQKKKTTTMISHIPHSPKIRRWQIRLLHLIAKRIFSWSNKYQLDHYQSFIIVVSWLYST